MAKKRIALSLDDYTLNLITSISEDLGKSKSDVVIEFFKVMGPALAHISAAKRMIDAGLKTTGEEAFLGFLRGMEMEFQESVSEAENLFFEKTRDGDKDGEHMQPDDGAIRRESSH